MEDLLSAVDMLCLVCVVIFRVEHLCDTLSKLTWYVLLALCVCHLLLRANGWLVMLLDVCLLKNSNILSCFMFCMAEDI